MKRSLAVGALSLPLAFGISGVALADSGPEAEIRANIEVQAEQRHDADSREEGILEELLGGLFGEENEFGEDNGDRSNDHEEDALLGGLL